MKILVIGAGPGGYVAALKAAQRGAEVTVVEGREVGGVCLNEGCIPTKTLIASAHAYQIAKHLDSFGIDLAGEVTPNFKKIMDRKNNVVKTQTKGIRGLFKSWGVTLVEGLARFISPKEIEVTAKDGAVQTLTADKFIIATGSRPALIPAFAFDGTHILSSTDALNLQEIPKSMIVVGAGVIGCEFACMFREFGTDVTMVELLPRALSTEDEEISQAIERELKKKKIKLFTEVSAQKVTVDGGAVTVALSNAKEISAEKLLVSIGRTFNTDTLGLDAAGVETGKRGNITVDAFMRTSQPDIYAIGDVKGGILLAHTASKEGIVAVENIMGHEEKMDYSVVPAGIFTTPEIGSVGMREHEAKEKGLKYRTGHFQYRGLGKSHAIGEITGMFKIIAEESTDRILGVHIVGHSAADLIHEAAVAMKGGLTVKDIAHTIHSHPTLSEGMLEAAEDVFGESIHTPKK